MPKYIRTVATLLRAYHLSQGDQTMNQRRVIMIGLGQDQQPLDHRQHCDCQIGRGDITPELPLLHAFRQTVAQSSLDLPKDRAQPQPKPFCLLIVSVGERGGKIAERASSQLLVRLYTTDTRKKLGQPLRRIEHSVLQRYQQQRLEALHLHLNYSTGKLLFRLEMVVEVAFGNAAPFQNIVHAGGLITDMVEQFVGAFQDFLLAALTPHRLYIRLSPSVQLA
jgi:hypothetical protein